MTKQRVDSPTGMGDLINSFDAPIKPPKGVTLSALELQVFEELIDGLPRDQWDLQGIRMAARLAKLEVYYDHLFECLLEEGSVMENDRGTPVSNPRHSAMTTTFSTLKMMRSTLGLTASQRTPDKAGQTARKAAEKRVRANKPKRGERPSLLAV
jgi:hypothetical protein